MGVNTGIEWCDSTWNPLRGCWTVSPGCANCYAADVAARFSGKGQPYEGLAVKGDKRGDWTGAVQLFEHILEQPLHWRTPRRIFVNSMSDLFYEEVEEEWIDRILVRIALCGALGRGHIFQILTKRAKRQHDYFAWEGVWAERLYRVALRDFDEGAAWGVFHSIGGEMAGDRNIGWPICNLHVGVSVENQRMTQRIEDLVKTPAAVRFLSIEPLLEDINITAWLYAVAPSAEGPWRFPSGKVVRTGSGIGEQMPSIMPAREIHWVIVGGESGQNRRPMKLEWLESVVQQCQDAQVPCFVKQDSALRPGQQGRISDELWALKQFPGGILV